MFGVAVAWKTHICSFLFERNQRHKLRCTLCLGGLHKQSEKMRKVMENCMKWIEKSWILTGNESKWIEMIKTEGLRCRRSRMNDCSQILVGSKSVISATPFWRYGHLCNWARWLWDKLCTTIFATEMDCRGGLVTRCQAFYAFYL